MKKWILILLVSLLICLSISPVLAVDYEGVFERTDSTSQVTNTIVTDGTGASGFLIKAFKFVAIEDYQSLSAINSYQGYGSYTWDYSVQGYSQDIYAWAGSTYLGHGWFGFFNNSATGNIVIFFYPAEWDTHGLTGMVWVNFSDNAASPTASATWTAHGLKDLTSTGLHGNTAGLGGWVVPTDITVGYVGQYVLNKQFIFKSAWNLTKSLGAVNVNVRKTVDNLPYKSKVYLYKPTGEIISSDLSYTWVDFAQTVSTYPLYIAARDMNGNWYNTSPYYNNDIGLVATPLNPKVNENVTVTAVDTTSNFTNCQFFTYMCSVGDRSVPCMYNASAALFLKTGTHWYQFDFDDMKYDIDKGIDFPASLKMNFTSPGYTTIRGVFTMIDGIPVEATTNINVTPDLSTSLIKFRAIDFHSGNLVPNTTISVYNYQTVAWSNLTTYTGIRDVIVSTGVYLGWTATSYGYEAQYETGMVGYDRTIDIIMNRNVTRPAGNNTLWIKVRDDLGNLVVGATVHLDDGQTTSTSNAGTAGFTVLDNQMYGITVSRKGYQGVSAVFYVSGVKNSVTLTMPRLVVTTAPTLAPGITAEVTIDSRTNEEKGDSMVKMLYDNGEAIVMLCIMMTIFGLLGVKFGK